eukprot:2680384-Rhodomonas_salina.1
MEKRKIIKGKRTNEQDRKYEREAHANSVRIRTHDAEPHTDKSHETKQEKKKRKKKKKRDLLPLLEAKALRPVSPVQYELRINCTSAPAQYRTWYQWLLPRNQVVPSGAKGVGDLAAAAVAPLAVVPQRAPGSSIR